MKKGAFIGTGAILAALTCYATVGSIISSVNLGYQRPFDPHCVYRDASYIYTMGGIDAVTCVLQYTTTGSLVKSIWLKDPYWLSDLDTCHLGSQFFCGTDWGFPPYHLFFFRVSDGSVVSSFTIDPPGSEYDTVVAWDGTHYYVAVERNKGEFARYTPARPRPREPVAVPNRLLVAPGPIPTPFYSASHRPRTRRPLRANTISFGRARIMGFHLYPYNIYLKL